MADDTKPPEDNPDIPKEMPELFMISEDALAKWVGFAEDGEIQVTIKRQDLDNLYFAIFRMVGAIYSANGALVEFTKGDINETAKLIDQSNKIGRICENHIKKFFDALIASATGDKTRGK